MRSSSTLPRLLLAALVAFAVTALAVGLVSVLEDAPRRPSSASGSMTEDRVAADTEDDGRAGRGELGGKSSVAREVLRAWDRARARAWASGDLAGLRTLYAPRSAAGARDVAMLRRWRERGLRVVGLQTQVLALRVLHQQPRRFELRVTDRLAAAVAVGPQGRMSLPRDRTSTWHIVLRRTTGTAWQVVSLEAARGGAP